MDATTLSGVVIAACGALIIGMAILIKTMVVSRLDELQTSIAGIARELHRLELKVQKLETEHEIHRYRPSYASLTPEDIG